jgi:hypothetical protein
MRKAILVMTVLAALGGCEQAKKGFDNGFDKSFRSSCIAAATKKGAPLTTVTKVCDCALTKIDERFTGTDRAGLSDGQLKPIMEECVNSVVQNNG